MVLYFKAIHIFGFVAWFAGLFYLVRMFVYHVEADNEKELKRKILKEQFTLMQKRVFSIICNTAAILTWFCGISMIYLYGMDWFKLNTLLHVKIVLLLILSGYHIYCGGIINKLEKGDFVMSAFSFRLFNELPSILLLAIVLLATLRSTSEFIGTLPYILAFMVSIYFIAKFYKKIRQRKTETK